jgi:disulfide bond formation protein DsbB
VTAQTAPQSAPVHAASNPALIAAWAVGLIALATLAGAWFFQLVLDIRPCPLCLEQRYAYYLAIPLAVLLERLDTVKVIRCDEVQWRFLGLSLAGYNVLISLLMAAIALWGAGKTARR